MARISRKHSCVRGGWTQPTHRLGPAATTPFRARGHFLAENYRQKSGHRYARRKMSLTCTGASLEGHLTKMSVYDKARPL